ncbi:MAG: hypothetical protein JSV35_02030 [Candidatus Bathyarchaeota archaeon]|nr:MAG: hypothetical protein JSV35_02030 [Candidatus Bathyarchaeota archaeon]
MLEGGPFSNYLGHLMRYLHHHFFGKIRDVQVFKINGSGGDADHSTNAVFIGSEDAAHQFASLLYSNIEGVRPLGRCLFHQIDPKCLPDADIIGVSTKGCLTARYLRDHFFLLPLVSFNLNLRPRIDQIIQRASRRRRRDLKKLQQLGYSHTISRDCDGDFDFFYRKMYLPYTKKRFGKAARLYSHSRLKAVYRRGGGIVFVSQEAQRRAGLLFRVNGGTVQVKSFGVFDADQNHGADLVGQAALFFLIKWAKRKGLVRLDYGITMPFFKDGVFIYKREWGMGIDKYVEQPFCAIKLNCSNEATISLLQRNPFIFLANEAMTGAIFLNHRPAKLELRQIVSRHYLRGLDALLVIAYYHDNTDLLDQSDLATMMETSTVEAVQPLSNITGSLQRLGYSVVVHEFRNPKISGVNPGG